VPTACILVSSPRRSRLVRDYVASEGGGIKLELLEPHAPERNPVEDLWAHWNQHEMPNFRPKDFAELSAFARAKFKRTPRREILVAAFWKQAELPFLMLPCLSKINK
jgi:transposase